MPPTRSGARGDTGVHACTIIARNYLPAARTLARSFAAHHPDGTFSVLVLDDVHGVIDATSEPFEVLHLHDLDEDITEIHFMAAIYDVMEFATSVKPWLLETLLARGWGSVLYIDPDIEIYDPIDELTALALERGIVLTPHARAPYPRDGLKTDETSILAAGVYNLGFIGVGETAAPFLAFWKERLRRECLTDPVHMRFVDQRWVDFVPSMFECAIVREPRFNVAYWNLHERDLVWTGDGYEVEGKPLGFFHFSGYSPAKPHVLSKHQGDRPRILFSDRPAVARICAAYGDTLVDNGFGTPTPGGEGYGFDQAVNGVPLDEYIRDLYLSRLLDADQFKAEPPPDPFDPDGAEELLAWMNSPPQLNSSAPNRLSTYQGTLYAYRPDLHPLFPDPQLHDFDRFQHWLRREAGAGRIHPLLVPVDPVRPEVDDRGEGAPAPVEARGSAAQWAPPLDLHPGIVVAGYLRAELGIGEGARLTVAAVEATGLPFSTVVYDKTNSRQQHTFDQGGSGRRDLDTNIVVVNADQFEDFAAQVGPQFFDGRHTIAQWAWELEEFPATWITVLKDIDEVWAVSSFARDAIAAVTDVPVFAFPHPIVTPVVPAGVGRRQLGLPDGFVFLFCFDLFSQLERKNPVGLIKAFCAAFEPGEGPTLVLKVINGKHAAMDLERIRLAVGDRPDIMIVDGYLTAGEHAALMAAADCYVSLHRSEGFGLTMAEAMALGKPVIATAYSGNLDFMTEMNSYLVPWVPGVVPDGAAQYPAGSRWADPDLDQAAALMRRVVERPEEAAAIAQRALEDVSTLHSVEARARFVAERFAAIQRQRATTVAALASGAAVGLAGGAPIPTVAGRGSKEIPSLVEQAATAAANVGARARGVAALAVAGPALDSPSRFGRLATFYRRLVRRAQRAELAHRRQVDTELTAAVSDLAAAVGHLALDLDGLAALTDAQQAELTRTLATHDLAIREHGRWLAREASLIGEPEGPTAGGRLAMWHVIDELRHALVQLHAVPDMGDPAPFMTTDGRGRPAIGYRLSETPEVEGGGYAEFEDVFRGPEPIIRERQRLYLEFLTELGPVLDVGCGRGEMLDLLAEIGVAASGVDLDPSMVARCRRKGHDVVQGDAIAYLSDQPEGSLGAVFSAQVVEHLAYDQLQELLRQSRRVLRPGGVFIAETVNPHALQAFKAFWTDLTHKMPIFPEVFVAQCRAAGFEEAVVVFPGGDDDLEADRFEVGDYAVVARNKPL